MVCVHFHRFFQRFLLAKKCVFSSARRLFSIFWHTSRTRVWFLLPWGSGGLGAIFFRFLQICESWEPFGLRFTYFSRNSIHFRKSGRFPCNPMGFPLDFQWNSLLFSYGFWSFSMLRSLFQWISIGFLSIFDLILMVFSVAIRCCFGTTSRRRMRFYDFT